MGTSLQTASSTETVQEGKVVAIIRKLLIDRFRGLKTLEWWPESGMNILLGGGDTGKTTILDAIALLLSPTNAVSLCDSDYWNREVKEGFSVEAVMSVPPDCGISTQARHAWPWEWNGKEAVLPSIEANKANEAIEVYRFRVRGTPDFELQFEVLQPDGESTHFPVGLRRAIGLVRLSGEDRNDRDLRLVQGSALDRLLSDRTLRARLGAKVAEDDIDSELKEAAQKELKALDETFKRQSLPNELGLGVTGGPGFSLAALIGLTAEKDGIKLPLVTWGAGTRRLAALEIAAARQGDAPVTLVDEAERGLEPYRQRALVHDLQASASQIFVTTHSPTVLGAASECAVWHLDGRGNIGQLGHNTALHRRRDPEAFLSRIAIIAEGPTERGLLSNLLTRAIGPDLIHRGIWISDGCGNDHTLKVLEALTYSGLVFGGFADNEGRDPNRWAIVQAKLGSLLFRWPAGCTETNIIRLIPEDQLESLIEDPSGERTGDRLRTLAIRLGIAEKDFKSISARASDPKLLIIEAATGAIPNADASIDKKSFRKHGEKWFKSFDGGSELADKVFALGVWPQLKPQLLPFLNAVRNAVNLDSLEGLPHE